MDLVHFEQSRLGTLGTKSTPLEAFKDIAVTANHSNIIFFTLAKGTRSTVFFMHVRTEQSGLGTF